MPGQTRAEIYAKAGAQRSDDGESEGSVELRMKNPDRIVHVRRVEIPGLEGEPAGILTLHEDVTAQRLALEAKDLMLRAIGHEVRSPAAAMKNTLAGIMQWDSTIDAGGRRELLQEAYESSDRLLSLVESQLIIAKLETRHFEPTPEPVDLASTLEGVMGVVRHRYAERALAVEVNLRDGLPPALCEPAHLAQVLTNLIGNALEYTSGAVSVQARAASRGWLEVTVADRGPVWVRGGGGMESVPDHGRHGPADRDFPPPGGPWEAVSLNGKLVGWAEHGGLAQARRCAEIGEQLADEERSHLLGRLGHKLRSAVLALQESARQAAFGRPELLEAVFEQAQEVGRRAAAVEAAAIQPNDPARGA